jgi:hypothetical protein
LLVALATVFVTLLPFVVPAVGWATLFLSSATRGTEVAWRGFVEATPGTVMGYGLIVVLVPLLAQPFFAAIVIVVLAAAGIAGRATKVAYRLFSTRRSSDERRRSGRMVLFARWPVDLRLLVASHPGLIEKLRRLIRVLDHEEPRRPCRTVLIFVVAPVLGPALATASSLVLVAIAYPGTSWMPSLLSLAADAVGYAGAGVFVATLAALTVRFSGESMLPRVTDWTGAFLSVAVLYAFMVLSGFISVLA